MSYSTYSPVSFTCPDRTVCLFRILILLYKAIVSEILNVVKIVSDCNNQKLRYRYDDAVHLNYCLEQAYSSALLSCMVQPLDITEILSPLPLCYVFKDKKLKYMMKYSSWSSSSRLTWYTSWYNWCFECSYGRSALPPAQIVMWKERISQCLSLPTKARVRPKHPRIFIVKRPLAVGRGFVNLHEIATTAQVHSFLWLYWSVYILIIFWKQILLSIKLTKQWQITLLWSHFVAYHRNVTAMW